VAFSLPNEISDELVKLQKMNEDIKNNLNMISEKRNKKDVQHQVLFISLVRVVKYFDAYLLLARNGYGEPAVCLLRSIFEASLWMRWSLKKYENAEIYFNASKAEAIRMLEITISKNLGRIKDTPDPELVRQLLKSKIKEYKLPGWHKMANDTDLGDLYAMIYPLLSAMSHGTMMFLGERVKNMEVSPEADQKNIKPFIAIAHNLLRDCYLVCRQWIINGKLRPVPDFRKLMTML